MIEEESKKEREEKALAKNSKKREVTFERRHMREQGQHHGWAKGVAWFDYSPPPFASGPDPDGWQDGWHNYTTAKIYVLAPGGYLAVSLGCHWENGNRVWEPTHKPCHTLEDAMDFCEEDMIANGVLPKSIRFGAKAK